MNNFDMKIFRKSFFRRADWNRWPIISTSDCNRIVRNIQIEWFESSTKKEQGSFSKEKRENVFLKRTYCIWLLYFRSAQLWKNRNQLFLIGTDLRPIVEDNINRSPIQIGSLGKPTSSWINGAQISSTNLEGSISNKLIIFWVFV